jgi:hypothetical protein
MLFFIAETGEKARDALSILELPGVQYTSIRHFSIREAAVLFRPTAAFRRC